jgi:hypothetical protein
MDRRLARTRPASGVWRLASGGRLAICVAMALFTSLWSAEPPVVGDAGHQTPDSRLVAPAARPVAVELTAAPAVVNVGDRVTLTLTYRWPHGWLAEGRGDEPDPARDLAGEFTVDLPPPVRTSTGEEERRVFTIVLAAQRAGAWALPRPTLTARNGKDSASAVAAPVIVQVGSEDKPPQLPAARPAWTPARNPDAGGLPVWIWICLTVALAGLGALAFTARRRRQVAAPTAWEVFASDWQTAGAVSDGKEAGARLSLALRRLAGVLFAFDGPGATARETLWHLRGKLSDDEQRDLGRLLDQLDQLRWAASDLAPSAVRPLIDSGQRWSAALKARLDAEAAAAAAAGKGAP